MCSIETSKDATDTATRRVLLNAKKNVNEVLDQVDGYANVSKQFSDVASDSTATQLGADAFKANKITTDEFAALTKGMSADELVSFKQGVLTELRQTAMSKGEVGYIKSNFSARDTIQRQKLEGLFGKEKVDKVIDATDRFANEMLLATGAQRALAGRATPIGHEAGQAGNLLNLGALSADTVATGGRPSVTKAAFMRKLQEGLTEPEAMANRTIMDILQSSPERAGPTMANLMDIRKLQQGAGGIAPAMVAGTAAGGGASDEFNNLLFGR